MKKLILILLIFFSVDVFSSPIEIVVPAVAGGPTDAIARTLSKILTDNNIENFISNHGGAEGDIGYNIAMEKKDNVIFAAPISYMVFSHVIQHRENLHAKNMNIIAPAIVSPMSIITGTKGFKSLKEMIEVAKTKDVPCGLSGGYARIALEMINQEYNTHFIPIPYKGAGQATLDVMGNQIECIYDAAGVYVAKHNAGQLVILGVNSKTPGLTNVPLISTVISDNKFTNWYGFGIPKNGNVNDNEKVLHILNNFSSYNTYLKPLFDMGFIPAKTNKNINQIIIEQTESARQYYKN